MLSPVAPKAPKQTGCGAWLVIAFLVVVIGAVVVSDSTQKPKSTADTAAETQRDNDLFLKGIAEATIKSGLRDPESADFRDVIVVHRDSVSTVCGSVNAKNGFGGFTGYTDFMTYHDRVMIQSSENGGLFVPRWNKWCAKLVPAPRVRKRTP